MRLPFTRVLYAAGAALGLAAASFGGYTAWNRLNPPQAITVAPQAGCDLQRDGCRAILPGGAELRLEIAPRPVPLARPIAFEVELAGLAAESVVADFASLDMFMGYHRRTLAPAGANRYRGETVLAACTRETMRWRVTVVVRSGRAVYSVPFAFETRTGAARRS
jgi:hypothetical protein